MLSINGLALFWKLVAVIVSHPHLQGYPLDHPTEAQSVISLRLVFEGTVVVGLCPLKTDQETDHQ
jgi:hypothetical protein